MAGGNLLGLFCGVKGWAVAAAAEPECVLGRHATTEVRSGFVPGASSATLRAGRAMAGATFYARRENVPSHGRQTGGARAGAE